MNNLDDPYSGMVNLMRNQGAKYNSPNMMIGKVLSSDPLLIQVGDIQLDKDNLYIADYLLNNYKRKITTTILVTGSAGEHSVSGNANANQTEVTFTDISLVKNDLVAIQQIQDSDMFIVFCKLI